MADAGKRVDAITNRPELDPANFDIYRAFWTLNRSRQTGMGVGSIPLTEIKAYLQIFDIEDCERFVFLIGETDDEYLTWTQQRSKS